MALSAKSALLCFLVGVLYLAQLQALPIPGNDAETVLSIASDNTTAIDTLGESDGSLRVKRQGGGCGCGCGCCCCRPRCTCTCCRTCCCTRCCTCCRPCCCRPCCCGCGGGGGGGCGGGCGCCGGGGCGGCGGGCCGCGGGGGRKRRSIQNLKIKLADKIEREQREAVPALPASSVQPAETVEPEQPAESSQPEVSPQLPEQLVTLPEQPAESTKDLNEFPFIKVDENAPTEWPQPVFELVTEMYA